MVLAYDRNCTACPRLAAHLAAVRVQYPDYHARPVAPFGAAAARLLIVGLAPGMHGANATGRPFTGDHAGILLYETLYALGMSNQAQAVSIDDGLQLHDCRITNAVKCLPPQNKPLAAEVRICNRYLVTELTAKRPPRAVVALGRIAHEAVLCALDLPLRAYPFKHGAHHDLSSSMVLFDSYHCSRYNTQTRRLTASMFTAVLASARDVSTT